MTRHASILHRKPRTRRGRVLARFHGVRNDANRRWRRLRHRHERSADHAKVQKLFLQLSHTARPPADPGVQKSRSRHLRQRH